MKRRKQYLKEHADFKMKTMYRLYACLMVFMFGVVIHDSFVHYLPFYYVLFILGGLIIGRIVSTTQKVSSKQQDEKLSLMVKPYGTAVIIILLILRFFEGKIVLESLNVI